MRINSNSWHCRLYLWWYEKKYGYPNEKGFSNLCPYMRAVMFWAPLRAIFDTWVKFGPIPLNVFSIPALAYVLPTVLGYHSYVAKMVIWSIYILFLVAAVMLAALCGLTYLLSKGGKDVTRTLRKKISNSSFPRLVSEYFRSAHDRVCPEIDWK